jgi:hypothetical protein
MTRAEYIRIGKALGEKMLEQFPVDEKIWIKCKELRAANKHGQGTGKWVEKAYLKGKTDDGYDDKTDGKDGLTFEYEGHTATIHVPSGRPIEDFSVKYRDVRYYYNMKSGYKGTTPSDIGGLRYIAWIILGGSRGPNNRWNAVPLARKIAEMEIEGEIDTSPRDYFLFALELR